MCSSKKWVGGLAALAALVVGGFVVMQTPVGTWAEVQWDKAAGWFNKQVSPEDQLAGLAKEVSKLDEEIDQQYDKIMEHKRTVEKTAKVVEAALDKSKPNSLATRWLVIKELDDAIKTAEKEDKNTVSFEKKSGVSVADARKERTARWDAFKRDNTALEGQKKLLEEQRATLTMLVETYDAMKVAKQDLEVKHQELKTKLESIRAAQAKNEAGKANDGWKTRFTKAHELAENLGDQFEVMNAKVQDQSKNLAHLKDSGAEAKVKNGIAAEEISKFEAELNATVNK
jgi:hypothetical protein